jgi:hypothetical protein
MGSAAYKSKQSTMDTDTKGLHDMSLQDRKACFAMLLLHVDNGILRRGCFVGVAKNLGWSERTVRRVFRQTLENMTAYLEDEWDTESMLLLEDLALPMSSFPDFVFSNNKKNSGRKKMLDRTALCTLTAKLAIE